MLTKEEKQKIIDDWNNGIEHPEYKVVKNNLGTVVRKRRYNKKTDVEGVPLNKMEAKEQMADDMKSKGRDKDKEWMKGIHYYNLTNTIDMLSRNVRDLDERLTKYKTKQVKLKGKYKELKRAMKMMNMTK